MLNIHHLNCVQIESSMGSAIGHCLLIEKDQELVLIDCGIGLLESKEPEIRLGKKLIEVTGFKFDENLTALRQIEVLGFNAEQVKHIICSHLDPDHIGGLMDFPTAQVHVSQEEYNSFKSGNDRYLQQQLAHQPQLKLYVKNDAECLGLPARRLNLNLDIEAYLIPLFGHTLGHCGVAIKTSKQWIFYVGDAYYLRAEMDDHNHPVDQLATIRAVDNSMRLQSLDLVRSLVKEYGDQMMYFGYHDPSEMA